MASLSYPRHPPNSFHRTHSKFACASPPTEFTEFTEFSGGEYPPTDFTDFHRSRRVWHPCHTHAALRIPSTEPIPSLLAQVLPQNSRNSQKFLAEKSLPRISQMYTEASGGEEPPTDFTDVHGFFFSASCFCVFCEFCGKIVLWLRGGRVKTPNINN